MRAGRIAALMLGFFVVSTAAEAQWYGGRADSRSNPNRSTNPDDWYDTQVGRRSPAARQYYGRGPAYYNGPQYYGERRNRRTNRSDPRRSTNPDDAFDTMYGRRSGRY